MNLPLINIFKQSFFYLKNNFKILYPFALINFLLFVIADWCGGWTHPVFLVFLTLAYVLWVGFFRHYFNIKPMFCYKAAFHSLSPSLKMLLLMFVVGLIFVFLPYIFIALGLPIDYMEQYIDNSILLNVIIGLFFLVLSPIILCRPYFAWIGSVIDRNYNLDFAYNHTKGNYFKFLILILFSGVLASVFGLVGVPMWVEYLWSSVVFLYFNIVMAKSYEFFFKV